MPAFLVNASAPSTFFNAFFLSLRLCGACAFACRYQLKTGLREIAKAHTGDFRLTANQNIIIGNVTPAKKPEIEVQPHWWGLIF